MSIVVSVKIDHVSNISTLVDKKEVDKVAVTLLLQEVILGFYVESTRPRN